MPVKVKICGLTNLADAQVALDAGADFLGFILTTKSPRYITPAQLGDLLAKLSLPAHVQTVGVFVNTLVDDVIATFAATGLCLAQLHGDEQVSALAALNGRGYKVIRPADASAARQANLFTSYPSANAPQLMVDTYHPTVYGGTGHQADWSLAHELSQDIPRLMLAGGLSAANVQSAIAAVGPWAVDVSSGVEKSPGQKDHGQVRAFVANARRAP